MTSKLNGGFLHKIPTTPAEARVEQTRVLRLLEDVTPGAWYAAKYGEIWTRQTKKVRDGLIVDIETETRKVSESFLNETDRDLAAQAPALATDLAAAYGLIATLLAERERVLGLVNGALQDIEELGLDVSLSGEDALDSLQTKLIQIRAALATAQAEAEGGEG